ncbi:MAG: hypothetical protein ACI9BF_000084 [Candidatus Paceibacteria bacterium]|jgi:hypothetical protein
MKKLKNLLTAGLFQVGAFVTLSGVAEADGHVAVAKSFVDKLNTIILFPTIALLSGVALLMFIWGCAEYFMNAANEEARRTGVSHITYGIIGLVIMLSAFSILSIVAGTFGLDVPD